jgi:hypothetical protein
MAFPSYTLRAVWDYCHALCFDTLFPVILLEPACYNGVQGIAADGCITFPNDAVHTATGRSL